MTNPAANPGSQISCCATPLVATHDDVCAMTLGDITKALEGVRGHDLAFAYGGRTTKPGYHITEFKFARVTGLDCGGNVESWSETILQLWDTEESVTGDRMTVNKLLGIARKAMTSVGAEASSRVVFEVSDGSDAMRIYAFDRLDLTDDTATVHLKVEVSACKPLVRGILDVPGSCGPKLGQGSEPVSRPAAASKCCG